MCWSIHVCAPTRSRVAGISTSGSVLPSSSRRSRLRRRRYGSPSQVLPGQGEQVEHRQGGRCERARPGVAVGDDAGRVVRR